MFIHRLCFMLSRAVIFLFIPIGVLVFGARLKDDNFSFNSVILFIGAIFVSLLPIIIFKYFIRLRCPRCGAKLDRDIIGASNYDCENCGASYS